MEDETLQFCVKDWEINALAIPGSYSIPRMDECGGFFDYTTVFSTLDTNSGYRKVEVGDGDRGKSVFTSHHWLLRLTGMQFGLKNEPGALQLAGNAILSSEKWQFTLMYLNDIIIFPKFPNEHIIHVRQVLTILKDAWVTLKFNKCQLLSDPIDYFGNVMKPGHVEDSSYATDQLTKLAAYRHLLTLPS